MTEPKTKKRSFEMPDNSTLLVIGGTVIILVAFFHAAVFRPMQKRVNERLEKSEALVEELKGAKDNTQKLNKMNQTVTELSESVKSMKEQLASIEEGEVSDDAQLIGLQQDMVTQQKSMEQTIAWLRESMAALQMSGSSRPIGEGDGGGMAVIAPPPILQSNAGTTSQLIGSTRSFGNQTVFKSIERELMTFDFEKCVRNADTMEFYFTVTATKQDVKFTVGDTNRFYDQNGKEWKINVGKIQGGPLYRQRSRQLIKGVPVPFMIGVEDLAETVTHVPAFYINFHDGKGWFEDSIRDIPVTQ